MKPTAPDITAAVQEAVLKAQRERGAKGGRKTLRKYGKKHLSKIGTAGALKRWGGKRKKTRA